MDTIAVLEEVAQEGLEVLRETLKSRSHDDAEIKLARIAQGSVASWSRVYQANSAREATIAGMIAHAAEDRQHYAAMIRASLPGTPIAKALADGK